MSWLKRDPPQHFGLVEAPGGIRPRAPRAASRVVRRTHPGFVGPVGSGGFVAARSPLTLGTDPNAPGNGPMRPDRTGDCD